MVSLKRKKILAPITGFNANIMIAIGLTRQHAGEEFIGRRFPEVIFKDNGKRKDSYKNEATIIIGWPGGAQSFGLANKEFLPILKGDFLSEVAKIIKIDQDEILMKLLQGKTKKELISEIDALCKCYPNKPYKVLRLTEEKIADYVQEAIAQERRSYSAANTNTAAEVLA